MSFPKTWTPLLAAVFFLPATADALPRERAIEQIPELMGRILESQEEIRDREGEYAPVVQRYNEKLASAKDRARRAGSEAEAADALVEYVETYAARLELQEEGLRGIQAAVVRMRADARELMQLADEAGSGEAPSADVERPFYEDHFQGVASATAELAGRLGREDEVATTGAVLQASWAVHGSVGNFPLIKLGPESAASFARRVDGLYAQYQARSNQLRAERRAVRRLLDLLIERQLGRRLDSLFAGSEAVGLGTLLSSEGKSEDWDELGHVVGRVLGMSSDGSPDYSGHDVAMDRLDYFGRGMHRDQGGR